MGSLGLTALIGMDALDAIMGVTIVGAKGVLNARHWTVILATPLYDGTQGKALKDIRFPGMVQILRLRYCETQVCRVNEWGKLK